ncbi:DUF1249 domain-containing protein [Marinimicrobium alkaliphilum]|uniref:DUF1249 domain-containing protein n=1 Tax=Marinimicrobium alkaliphilum TaxID=2202654 RepID=UPI000DBAD2D4|nr:DUF1249 domain-containing protein [Marinimicrobium alkaliphilum]
MIKPRYKVDLPREQAECEANYTRLRKLMPGSGDSWRLAVGENRAEREIRIHVEERARYTTTIKVAQVAGELPATDWLSLPRLTVRLYHDARMAEVLAWEGHRRIKPRYDYPNTAMYHSDEKFQFNRFLGEWLSLCLNQGRSTVTLSL